MILLKEVEEGKKKIRLQVCESRKITFNQNLSSLKCHPCVFYDVHYYDLGVRDVVKFMYK